MVGEDDFSNSKEELNNLVVASTLDISVIEAVDPIKIDPTSMSNSCNVFGNPSYAVDMHMDVI